MKSHITSDFKKCFEKLPERIKQLAKKNYKIWQKEPNYPSLVFKRVSKKYPIYSIRIGLGWRALGIKREETIIWLWIGSHADYEKLI